MPRADELEPLDRTRHPETGDIVTVTRVLVGLNRCRVHFRRFGFQGSFTVKPHTELEDCG